MTPHHKSDPFWTKKGNPTWLNCIGNIIVALLSSCCGGSLLISLFL